MENDFLNYIEIERRYSTHTVKSYKLDISQFKTYLSEEFEASFSEVSRDMIRSWIVYMMENGNSKTTVHRKISTIKSFYKYLEGQGAIFSNPVYDVALPRKERRLPVFLTCKQAERLLDLLPPPSTFEQMRDQLILELFYQTGIRVSELVNIKESDVDLGQRQLKVMGKRRKERIIPIMDSMTELMIPYLEQRKLLMQEQNVVSSYFFLLTSGKPIYSKLVYRRVNHYLTQISSVAKKSPHVMRHTFATHMLDKGADINAVKELLGHASLAATQVYTHNTMEKIQTVYKKAHPRA